MYFYINNYNASAAVSNLVTINSKEVAHAVTEAQSPTGARAAAIAAVLPVNVGDVVAFTTNATGTNGKYLYYMPERWV